MPKETKSKLPKCKLTGTDGNVFAVIGTVSRALEKAGQREQAMKFKKEAFEQHSYDAVLALCFKYVDVR